jgi:hypothetical protein
VVAERDDIGARAEQRVGELRREPGAVRGVLSVDDAEVDLALLAQAGQRLLDRTPAGRAEDVCNEENPQGIESVAAGWTSIVTWFPASCV